MGRGHKRSHPRHDDVRGGDQKRLKPSQLPLQKEKKMGGMVNGKHSRSGSGNGQSRSTIKTASRAKVPFGKKDNILLLGEGDFSFSSSLLKSHGCRFFTATSYDSYETLLTKYPNIQTTLDDLIGSHKGNGAADVEKHSEANSLEDGEWRGFSPSPSDDDESLNVSAEPSIGSRSLPIKILHSVDAKKAGSSKEIRNRGPFDKIIFNFPHVGGITKDVNRQVRLNQELLVGFLKSCKGLLSSPTRRPRHLNEKSDRYDTDEEDELLEEGDANDAEPPPNGQVILTVFEGEPYSLWNVRDLARHSGYRVVESFRFPWEAYPGYKHARTLGDVQGKEREDGKRSGAWRGEERDARMYLFEINDSSQHHPQGDANTTNPRRKGKPGSSSKSANGDTDDESA